MPTYEYVCEKCGHQFEKVQPISAAPLTICPKELCAEKRWGKGKVKRAISAGGGLLFKGSGFYITDYAKSSGSKSSESKSSTSAKSKDTAATPAASSAKPDSGGSPSK